MQKPSRNCATGENTALDLLPKQLSTVIRRAARYCSTVITAMMPLIFDRLPVGKIEKETFLASFPNFFNNFHLLFLRYTHSISRILAYLVQMKTFVFYWGMPTFHRFNIYDNQSNEKLIPQC